MREGRGSFRELVRAITQMKTEAQVEDFLFGILTPRELDEISTRLQIVKMLKQGFKQESIVKELRVGISTVTRGSREIRKGHFKYV